MLKSKELVHLTDLNLVIFRAKKLGVQETLKDYILLIGSLFRDVLIDQTIDQNFVVVNWAIHLLLKLI